MEEPVRYIAGEDGAPDEPLPDGLDASDLIAIYRWMVLLRTFDERAVALQRQGRMGTYPMFWGEEATQAGPVYACSQDDWLFPSYRQGVIGILRGLPPSTIFKYRRGFGGRHGFWNPRSIRVAPSTVAIATQLPHATGLAYAAALRGDSVAAVAWCGDGATSEGDFHEALNFASVWRVPAVFFCVNNQWAISTPFKKQTAVETLAHKALAYGVPSIRVDGFDPIACWKGTRDALERARNGGGPSLIEAYCYRLAPHGTADDPSRYRDESVTKQWRKLEPVARTAAYLERTGILDAAGRAEIHADAAALIARAVSEMEELTTAPPEILFETVYAGIRPYTFDEGLKELRPE